MRALALALAAVLATAAVGGCGNGANQPGPKGPTGGGDEDFKPAPGPGDMGSLPQEKVEELNDYFTKKGIQVSRCYQQEVERRGDRSFVGKVTVKLRIGKEGKASKVEILETTLKSPPVEQCIVEQILSWTMPELPNAIMWTWTFEFQPAW
ncbi:MAG: AgmX/PglI C-terminal domain-containing protein [Deltaproteobacteria bacterium]|nr:AgmX/PglI C-terminal domain-containing protein [Deltaproteobacteria bacterium]